MNTVWKSRIGSGELVLKSCLVGYCAIITKAWRLADMEDWET